MHQKLFNCEFGMDCQKDLYDKKSHDNMDHHTEKGTVKISVSCREYGTVVKHSYSSKGINSAAHPLLASAQWWIQDSECYAQHRDCMEVVKQPLFCMKHGNNCIFSCYHEGLLYFIST